MSIMHLRVEVCDVCQDRNRRVINYRLAAPGDRLRVIALCEEHAEPIKALLASIGGDVTPRRPRREPVSMSEVSAARKRPPQRKK